MDHLLKFLITSMRTIDGKRGTAEPLLRVLNDKKIQEYK